MKVHVEHIDHHGSKKNQSYDLSYLQFIKHMAFAGMGVHKSVYNAFRFAGFMIEFIPYWRQNPNSFLLPKIIMHDPTELGQVSNRIGKTLADFLAKKIYGAKYTHNYEDAMVQHGHPIKGQRPDLYCDTFTQQFSIEAKGYKRTSISKNQMAEYKLQSQQGPIPVHFSVASVAFNLYNQPKVKFHDPVGADFKYSKKINKNLISIYYESLLSTLKQLNIEPLLSSDAIPNDFLAYRLPDRFFQSNLYLLIHQSILERKWSEMHNTISEFSTSDENTYIDVDGIGLCIR